MTSPLGELTITQGQRLVRPPIALTVALLGRPQGFQIGRAPDSDVELPDQRVSGRHLQIRLVGDRPMLVHLSQSNPTLLDGAPLPAGQPVPLPERATLSIPPYSLSYVGYAPAPAAAPPAPPAPPPAPVAAPPAFAWPIPADRPGRYLADLPAIYQASWPQLSRPGDDPAQLERRRFLGDYLKIFEAIWEPLEQRQDHLDLSLSPRTCPEAMLPLLARWLGMPLPEGLSVAGQRALLAAAPQIYALRGTMAGLQLAISAATGLSATISETPGRPFTVTVALPAGQAPPELLRALIRSHKPAHTGYVLEEH
ncbi:FHA domain-containing protein [Oscillochloris sp. ZM17-4]|uniref:FHA domain-containing protein n=1 Tax=Oscillochloris sp. ZM17-4 TaxID=2866714 RepID=UPI001C733CCD|nr:phage tail protein [Oscillochloris sp. ZM17-4]MBX0331215.1 FHA domain-containing protein [Oscillochloris sp. ZM17-4]